MRWNVSSSRAVRSWSLRQWKLNRPRYDDAYVRGQAPTANRLTDEEFPPFCGTAGTTGKRFNFAQQAIFFALTRDFFCGSFRSKTTKPPRFLRSPRGDWAPFKANFAFWTQKPAVSWRARVLFRGTAGSSGDFGSAAPPTSHLAKPRSRILYYGVLCAMAMCTATDTATPRPPGTPLVLHHTCPTHGSTHICFTLRLAIPWLLYSSMMSESRGPRPPRPPR